MNTRKNFILEGPDVEQKNFAGKQIMAGWRHYKCVFGGRVACVISLPMSPAVALASFDAKLFPRGTWEDETRAVLPGRFHEVKSEVAKEVWP